MIYLKSREEIVRLRRANQVVAALMMHLKDLIRPGIRTVDLDREAEEFLLKEGAKPAFKGYKGYEHCLCTSINEEVVHGIPGRRELKEGDIISIDCGVYLDGFYGDHAWTLPVGKIGQKSQELLQVAEEALEKGIEKMAVGNRLYDVSYAIQSHVESHQFSVVKDFVGHGVGKELHEEPQVPNFGTPGTGIRLRPGLVLALEPMVNEGTWEVRTLADGWTVVTKDGRMSAHFEHSVAVTEKGPDVLSKI